MSSGSSSQNSSSRAPNPSSNAYYTPSSLRPNAITGSQQPSTGWPSNSANITSASTPQYSVTSPTFTPASQAPSTTLTSTSSGQQAAGTLDIGPPGWTATIRLWEGTQRERTIYLGPWEIVGGAHHRRILWQCSYRGESIEHFLPQNDVFPYTLHRNHRQFSLPNELEQYVGFREQHRIRYRDASGTILHDHCVEVKYEFSLFQTSYQFQGDLRCKDLIDYFDVDCIYSDQHPRQNSYGVVSGLGAIQRIKLWKDRYASYYSLSFFANRTDREHHEFQTHLFNTEIRNVDETHQRLRLYARGRRGSAPSGRHGSRFNIPFRSRQRSVGSSSQSSDSEPQLPFRYIGIQFTDDEDFGRFFERWAEAHDEGVDFNGVAFPSHHIELPGTHIIDENAYEMEGDVPYYDDATTP